jgi:NAD(P)-dependent dehydrogenase (short-subunit alcohol dehydrogenase family)
MQHVLITGSNRGIGLGLVKEFLSRENWHIIATCRNPADASELRQLAEDTNMERVTVLELDVSNQQSIDRAFNMVTSEITDTLDVLINNAGINPKGEQQQHFENIDFDTMLYVLRVNTAAPLQITQAAYPLLKKSENPRVVNISSNMGSIGSTGSGGAYAYRISKAGINMLSKVLSVDLKNDDIITVALDPGWVQTDMGGSGARLTPEKSANGIVNVVTDLTPAQSGSYLKWDGSHHEW